MAVGPISSQVVEEVRRRRRESLAWMQALADDADVPGRFYGLWAGKVVETTGARSIRSWVPQGDRDWKLAAFAGTDGTSHTDADETEPVRVAHLDEVRRTERPRLSAAAPPAGSPTATAVVWYPLTASGKLRGVVELRVTAPTEAARRG